MGQVAAELRAWLHPPSPPPSLGPLDLSACKRDLDDLLRQAAAQKQVRDEKHQWAVAQGTRIRDRLRPVMQSVHLASKKLASRCSSSRPSLTNSSMSRRGPQGQWARGRIALFVEISVDQPKEGWGKIRCYYNTGSCAPYLPSVLERNCRNEFATSAQCLLARPW